MLAQFSCLEKKVDQVPAEQIVKIVSMLAANSTAVAHYVLTELLVRLETLCLVEVWLLLLPGFKVLRKNMLMS